MGEILRRYRDQVVHILDHIVGQTDAFEAVRDAVATALAAERLIYVTGSGHSHLIAEEVFYRAGGIAAAGKARGATTVALTSLQHTRSVSSRHPSGKRLFEVCDLVLDNGAEYGDASLPVGRDGLRMGPTSTITEGPYQGALIQRSDSGP
jgi:uncharacterized phosphosugar-binding protein